MSQAIVRVEYGPGNPKCAPKNKGCKPRVNLVQTKSPCVNLVQTKFLGRFHVNVKGSMRIFFRHGRLLNLFFDSFQMDGWLQRYDHFNFGVGWCTKTKFAGFTCCGLRAYD